MKKRDCSARTAGVRCALFEPSTTRPLYSVKDKLPHDLTTNAIYSIKCKTCDDEYVGETLRALQVRAKEHRDAIRLAHGKYGEVRSSAACSPAERAA